MGGVRARDEHPGRKAHRVSACSHERPVCPRRATGATCTYPNPVQRPGRRGVLVGQASVTCLLEAGPKSHATTAEGGSPREAEAQLPEGGLCGRKARGRHGACALSLTVPVHKGPLTLDGRLPQPSHLPLRRRRRTGEAQRSQVAARPFKTCSGCIRAFESEFGTTDTLSQTALQWGVLHPRGAELRLCLCSLGARNPPQAVASQLSLDFARCDKDSHPGGRRRSP